MDSSDPYEKQWLTYLDFTKRYSFEVLHDEGQYRHLKMKPTNIHLKHQQRFWEFDVVTAPGLLAYTGVTGVLGIFIGETDMFKRLWFKKNSEGPPSISFRDWLRCFVGEPATCFSQSKFVERLKEAGLRQADIDVAIDYVDTEESARDWLEFNASLVGEDAAWEWELHEPSTDFALTCYAVADMIGNYLEFKKEA